MKILLTGKEGLLGRDCLEVLAPQHTVLALNHRELDITDPAQVEEAVDLCPRQAISIEED